ncbi:hypothetical protein ACOSQ3_032493 [Xanthoceras sorbifolium]
MGPIKLGSWGGPGGFAWDFNLGTDFAIIEIVINNGDVVDSVSFKSFNRVTGQIVSSGTHGDTGGVSDKISIDGSEKHLTLISGTVFDYFGTGNLIVQSLTFHTNKTSYGPYGLTNDLLLKFLWKMGKLLVSLDVLVLLSIQ